jgi:hypothetical protein
MALSILSADHAKAAQLSNASFPLLICAAKSKSETDFRREDTQIRQIVVWL